MYEIDEYKKKIENIKRETSSKKSELEQKKTELENKIEELHQEIERLKNFRKETALNIPSSLYDEYRELMKKHKGTAVVQVINSVCQGC
ncbi:hypothetical protein, partial [Escherichia coli]|uniref:hypothetical protein n=1 Tax=Escherichia coli TaxID=562 RepID=UPI00128EBE46